ncbi:uncharacterized protein LOC125238456 [Leguminivora glycinivorella]|uniref:uncharacterized protein LOC125227775 n=1 Tax=Leguminivora glycinivorella TaxID=1035111 RepID=UPI0020102B42|nr:uncharacterized protein LOC125227775 [Leguminivora glycinivorella]XP_047990809.1 uncharacterized protein LOC125229912 [Leguminivora glycinivorella]XP_047991361.1 uncharacterized protein LOC125230286 [Leguminivora glycinivorella]XP_047992999.1 uncharacterized protein LOC125231584 [Leguminivora glycinivorella]XP_048001770.1 uncharacterized protein LOC125238456 [Leguminivora glycinivorella]
MGSQPINHAAEMTETTPFYSQVCEKPNDPLNYSQDMDAYLKYQDLLLNPSLEIPLSGTPAKSQKKIAKKGKRKIKEMGLNSHVIRKVTKGKRLIKISISDLEQSNIESNGVTVQYVVQDDYDELLNATEGLVEKIVKKLSEVSNY